MLLIKVCDAQMGLGKTTAVMKYMNAHPDERYIYITPFLSEAERVKNGCPELKFREPSNKIPEFNYSKVTHTKSLIEEGRNIVSTHQALKFYTGNTLELIKERNYTLIIDESMEMMESFNDLKFSEDDLTVLEKGGYIRNDGDRYSLLDDNYQEGSLKSMFRYFESRELLNLSDSRDTHYWAVSTEILTSFKDVFILTYLFEHQNLHHLLLIYNIPFEYIGVRQVDCLDYELCPKEESINYIPGIGNHIHILDNYKMNKIGKGKFALSRSWFDKESSDIKQLKNNMHNYFGNIYGKVKSEFKMWGCYKKDKTKLKGKGYSSGYLNFNARATNDYRHKYILAYPVNIFMNVGEKQFYKTHGIEINEDKYALAIMLQWIWRSAIRDGRDIYLYLPSERMRDILGEWIESTKN